MGISSFPALISPKTKTSSSSSSTKTDGRFSPERLSEKEKRKACSRRGRQAKRAERPGHRGRFVQASKRVHSRLGMKKLRKLKDGYGKTRGGAVRTAGGSGIGSATAGSVGEPYSVRSWIFDHSRRLRQTDLKCHEIRYMDLNQRETQLIRQKARPKQNSRTQELSGSFEVGDSLDDDRNFKGAIFIVTTFILIVTLVIVLLIF